MRAMSWNRINTGLLLIILVVIIGAFATRATGGPLDPSGTPGPTQPQVEPRGPIPPVGWDGSFPIVISQAGSYFLTRNLTDSDPDNGGISITTGSVTLDLNGFSLTEGSSFKTNGIKVADGSPNIEIKNGRLDGWLTGIQAAYADQSRIDNVEVSGSLSNGIDVGSGSIVSRVRAEGNGAGVVIEDPHLKYFGGLLEDSILTRNGDGVDVVGNNVTVRRNVIDSNARFGVYLVGSAFAVVTDNTIQGTDGPSTPCVRITGNENTVARNVIDNCSGGPFSVSGAGNRVGPATSDLTSTQPWSNAEY
jgi:parallel beta-helix repeat protein